MGDSAPRYLSMAYPGDALAAPSLGAAVEDGRLLTAAHGIPGHGCTGR